MIFSNIVGSIVPWKGLHIYLEAIEDINCQECSFELVGGINVAEVEYYNQIKEKFSKEMVQIDFIQNMKAYYEHIDVVVHTSIVAEPFGLVLLEGMAKGKVIIATDGGAVREVVDDSYGNIIVPQKDIAFLKEAIVEVSTYSKERLFYIKKKNIEHAKNNFTLEKQMQEIQNLYSAVYNA